MKWASWSLAMFLSSIMISGASAQQGRNLRNIENEYHFDKSNTPGWALITPEERSAYHQRISSSKTYAECKSIHTEQISLMKKRAEEQGVKLRRPRTSTCNRMKARGKFSF